jgi:hypothetical protein
VPTVTYRPNGEVLDSGLVASNYTDHDSDPDVVSSTTSALSGSSNTQYGVSFPTPTTELSIGLNAQEFRVGADAYATGGTPQIRIELWENGSFVRSGSTVNVGSSYSVFSFRWSRNNLSDASGAGVECRVFGIAGGGNSVNIGQIEWVADQTETLPIDPEINVNFGVYSVGGFGVVTDTDKHTSLNLESGSYQSSGQVVTTGTSLAMQSSVDFGIYLLSGQPTTKGLGLGTSPGVYLHTGFGAITDRDANYHVAADTGLYSLQGQDTETREDVFLFSALDSGSYQLTGLATGTEETLNETMPAGTGSYLISGNDSVDGDNAITEDLSHGVYSLLGYRYRQM